MENVLFGNLDKTTVKYTFPDNVVCLQDHGHGINRVPVGTTFDVSVGPGPFLELRAPGYGVKTEGYGYGNGFISVHFHGLTPEVTKDLTALGLKIQIEDTCPHCKGTGKILRSVI